jgi:hypothetical protein
VFQLFTFTPTKTMLHWITHRLPTFHDCDEHGCVDVPGKPEDIQRPGYIIVLCKLNMVKPGQEWWPRNPDARETALAELGRLNNEQPQFKPAPELDFPNDPMAQAELEELRAKTLMWQALAFRISKSDHALYINLPRF